MKNYLQIALLFMGFQANSQKLSTASVNLDFEQYRFNGILPDKWINWSSPNFTAQIDSSIAYGGKFSTAIFGDDNADSTTFGSMAHVLPANYKGSIIRLEGYMKIENVADGYAGLLMRIDDKEGKSIEFDNMDSRRITGSHDWKKYSVMLRFPKDAHAIYVAGILCGKGKAWFDNFEVFIDNKNIKDLDPIVEPVYYASLDKEFETGTDIKIEHISEKQTNNLYKLAKIWGFVKYYHPKIAKGTINWDNELFRILPDVLQASSEKAAEKVMANWLLRFPIDNDTVVENLSKKTIKSEVEEIKLTARTEWFKNKAIVSSDLCKMLSAIENSPRFNSHYYIGFLEKVNNPIFKHESEYKFFNYTDDGIKLLALFRYWNMIEYFFPYRHLMDDNWDKTLKAFIPKMLVADDELAYTLELLHLIGKIQDTHATILQPNTTLTNYWGNNIAPIDVKMIENKVVVTRVDEDNKQIKVGDIITAVNGNKVADWIEEKRKYCPASNNPVQLRELMRRLLRTNNRTIDVSIEGKDVQKIYCTSLSTYSSKKDETLPYKVLDGDIGYLYPGTLKKGEAKELWDKIMNTKGLIIDLRCYPSDPIIHVLGQYLMPKMTEFVKITEGSLEKPGNFTFRSSTKVGINTNNYYKGKIAILINETTQSHAEFTAMAMRVAPNATVIGSTTAAADGNVSSIILPGNVKTRITGIGIYTPDGKETQRVGIIPDIEIHPTIQGIRDGKDELLDKALEVVHR
jgi:C-terminal processing protease CtpA/Prc